jgi:hypothetical protein
LLRNNRRWRRRQAPEFAWGYLSAAPVIVAGAQDPEFAHSPIEKKILRRNFSNLRVLRRFFEGTRVLVSNREEGCGLAATRGRFYLGLHDAERNRKTIHGASSVQGMWTLAGDHAADPDRGTADEGD